MTCAPNATRTRDLPLRRSFHVGGQLPHSWSGRSIASGCRSMSVVPASFWHAAGTAHSPPPGPVRARGPRPASSAVHTHEDHDQQNMDSPVLSLQRRLVGVAASCLVLGAQESSASRDLACCPCRRFFFEAHHPVVMV